MSEQLVAPSKSAEQYFEMYGRNGIGKGMDRILVRRQLIDAFHKEIFAQAAWLIPKHGDSEALRIARQVIKNEARKWIKLCGIFEKYKETSGLLKYDDISISEEDLIKVQEAEQNDR